MDKLGKITPILVIALLGTQIYLIWAMAETKEQTRRATNQTLDAGNRASEAAVHSRAAVSEVAALKTQLYRVSASCSSCRRCPSANDLSLAMRRVTTRFGNTYREVLLEDLALKAG